MRLAKIHHLFGISLLLTVSAAAQDYRIDWYSINGGGGTSTGGVFTLSGTIGQSAVDTLAGGNYLLESGFWGGIVAIQQPGAPTLHIERSGLNVIISWDSSVSGFSLQEADKLQPDAWGTSSSGSTNPISIPAIGANRFYRLSKP